MVRRHIVGALTAAAWEAVREGSSRTASSSGRGMQGRAWLKRGFSAETRPISSATVARQEATEAAAAKQQREAAKMVTERFMFPWERRQMGDGKSTKGLSTWEKAYWGVFVGAMSLLLFNRMSGADEVDPDFVLQRRRRQEAARILMGGQAKFHEDSPFDGLSPRELTKYLRAERKRLGMRKGCEGDAFEGMGAEEIVARIDGEIHERDPRHPRFEGMTEEEALAAIKAERPKKLGTRVRELLGFGKKDQDVEGEAEGGVGDGKEGPGGAQGSQGTPAAAAAPAPIGALSSLAAAGQRDGDEFEGMSPEEIDAAMGRIQVP